MSVENNKERCNWRERIVVFFEGKYLKYRVNLKRSREKRYICGESDLDWLCNFIVNKKKS